MSVKNDKKIRFIDFIMITIGTALYAFGFVTINIANRLAEGGIAGITLLLKFLAGVNPAISTILINIPLLIIGYRYLGRRSLIYTIYGTGILSFWIWFWQIAHVSLNVHHDLFIAAILAGIIGGFGLGLVYRFNGTTGGTDIIARIFEKKKGSPMGQSLFALDFVVLAVSLTYIDLRRMMYTLVASFVLSRVVNFIQDGGYSARGIIVMTQHSQEISHEIIEKMDRGVTYLQTEGAFSGRKGKALYTVVSQSEITEVKRIIAKYDKHAFVSVIDVNEVIGEGFTYEPIDSTNNK
ncbi:MAG TPA: YitT family protein [Candidatus Ligilactobacillus excrementigallinarum]|uniref:YitT family protein n=1 Tax=Candidatus Ligilactobacillus excrementigallinarum TaxID=2838641 RepID=A0A9D2AB36_9LACO|nr:YitT family protein [Candidatus Ligilactobacillus excrementigallinarum]